MKRDSLSCWGCNEALSPEYINQQGFLKSRAESRGGPFIIGDCPKCRRKFRCERTAAGRLFLSPADDLSALDHLFRFFDGELRARYWEERDWRARNEERRRRFFAADGDFRYGSAPTHGAWRPASRSEGGPHPAELPPTPRQRRLPPAAARRPRTARGEAAARSREAPSPVRHALDQLGVSTAASWEEIARAFRVQCKLCHPDLFALHDEAYRSVAARRFAALKESFDLLKREWKPLIDGSAAGPSRRPGQS